MKGSEYPDGSHVVLCKMPPPRRRRRRSLPEKKISDHNIYILYTRIYYIFNNPLL